MKKMLLCSLLGMGVVFGTGLAAGSSVKETGAYFQDKDRQENPLTVGNLRISLTEDEWNPEEDGKNMYPGYCVRKNPTVKNITSETSGEKNCFLRMEIAIKDENGELITDQKALSLIWETIRYSSDLKEGDPDGYTRAQLENIPTVNPAFTEAESTSPDNVRIYYYNKPFERDQELELFSHIVIPNEWTMDELKAAGDFQVVVTAQVVQKTGFDSVSEAFDAALKEGNL